MYELVLGHYFIFQESSVQMNLTFLDLLKEDPHFELKSKEKKTFPYSKHKSSSVKEEVDLINVETTILRQILKTCNCAISLNIFSSNECIFN